MRRRAKHLAGGMPLLNLLCVRLDSLGDVLMTTPAIRALKEARPGRRVTLLTSPSGAAAARLVPEIDEVIVYEAPWMKHSTAGSAGASREYAMAEQLRRRSFDAAVIFTVYSQNPLPAAFLCYLAGIPLRLAHCRENPYQLLTELGQGDRAGANRPARGAPAARPGRHGGRGDRGRAPVRARPGRRIREGGRAARGIRAGLQPALGGPAPGRDRCLPALPSRAICRGCPAARRGGRRAGRLHGHGRRERVDRRDPDANVRRRDLRGFENLGGLGPGDLGGLHPRNLEGLCRGARDQPGRLAGARRHGGAAPDRAGDDLE